MNNEHYKDLLGRLIPPLTECMKKIKFNVRDLTKEDHTKYDRLSILSKITNIKCNLPIAKLKTSEILSQNIDTKFKGRCGWRLVPINPLLPKLRTRGKTMKANTLWLKKSKINYQSYPNVEIIPQTGKITHSGIFVINDDYAFGEITKGDLWKLVYGHNHKSGQHNFIFDFKKWEFSKKDDKIKKIIKKIIGQLKIKTSTQSKKIKNDLGGQKNKHGFIKGYFEFRAWENKILIVDYDRILYKLFKQKLESLKPYIQGTSISGGIVDGKAKIITNPKKQKIDRGDIIICPIITMDYLPLIAKSAGVISERGNVLSHTAFIVRELKKPCLVWVKDATKILKNKDRITLDAKEGVVIIN